MIGPELGVTQPGKTIVCGDSHTSTHGAFGALAFGIGTTEVEHVLASQCLLQRKAKNFEIRIDGQLKDGVTAKDIILLHHLEDRHWPAERAASSNTRGSAIRALNMDGAHDRLQHVHRRRRARGHGRSRRHDFRVSRRTPLAPKGAEWDKALAAGGTDDGRRRRIRSSRRRSTPPTSSR